MGMADRAINYMFGDLKKAANAIKKHRDKMDKKAQQVNKQTNKDAYKKKGD